MTSDTDGFTTSMNGWNKMEVVFPFSNRSRCNTNRQRLLGTISPTSLRALTPDVALLNYWCVMEIVSSVIRQLVFMFKNSLSLTTDFLFYYEVSLTALCLIE